MKIVKKEYQCYYSNDGCNHSTIEEALKRDELLSYVGNIAFLLTDDLHQEFCNFDNIRIVKVKILQYCNDNYFEVESLQQNIELDYCYKCCNVFKTYIDAKLELFSRLQNKVDELQVKFNEIETNLNICKEKLRSEWNE